MFVGFVFVGFVFVGFVFVTFLFEGLELTLPTRTLFFPTLATSRQLICSPEIKCSGHEEEDKEKTQEKIRKIKMLCYYIKRSLFYRLLNNNFFVPRLETFHASLNSSWTCDTAPDTAEKD